MVWTFDWRRHGTCCTGSEKRSCNVAHVLEGSIEVDETYVSGKEKNKRASRKQRAGRGGLGKAAVAGRKDRKTKGVAVKALARATKASIHDVVDKHRSEGGTLYTDEPRAFEGLEGREAVKRSVGEYVGGMAHTNGWEELLGDPQAGAPGRCTHKLSVKTCKGT